ncbi:NADH-quinone oxidoreductase subunit M [Dietzia psychralcaliphila]|uniref:NADH-quinone oxidoreductase subunit M n=1 Tax=Dietzia psychralcaliphila TaxID=139021 RepID=A0AAD0JQC0_9ACTN|nr:NADH-quinone oxidoreductase subunit M [Dietzia psychralcaliphila]AWH94457.1 NADH-quinone oxidoreductase subunit M [Dietzia psychralcaliphila]PTM88105.1 NADH-quinone oxidoreductase subunit M [Dietzia psychralcaliphila]
MNGLGLLSALWLTPLIGALVVVVLPSGARRAARPLALATSLVVLGVAIALAVGFDPGGATHQFVESRPWIPAFGATYSLGLDGIALVLVLLTAALMPLLLLAGWHDVPASDSPTNAHAREAGAADRGPHSRRAQTYPALMLATQGLALVAFTSLDVLLFYVAFEAMLIPLYFLIGGFGGSDRAAAAVRFLIYNLLGGLVMLVAVIGLYVLTAHAGIGPDDGSIGAGTFDYRLITAAVADGRLEIPPGAALLMFAAFTLAFAIKAPLWPFHTWLPGAAVAATPASAVLMMAVVDKVGTFAMLRYSLPLFPDAAATAAPVLITLAVISIVYGGVMAIAQTDLLRLIAYASISHFGFIVLGIFARTEQSAAGSALYMVNHGVATAALFLVAGFLVRRHRIREIGYYGGVQQVAPVLAGTFLIAGLATLSLPGLAPFVSEFLVFVGTFGPYPVAAVLATSTFVLAAIYILWTYQRVMGGPVAPGLAGTPDLGARELVVVIPLVVALIALGLYPQPALDVIEPAVAHTVALVGGAR